MFDIGKLFYLEAVHRTLSERLFIFKNDRKNKKRLVDDVAVLAI